MIPGGGDRHATRLVSASERALSGSGLIHFDPGECHEGRATGQRQIALRWRLGRGPGASAQR
jgi:hypothetical protein